MVCILCDLQKAPALSVYSIYQLAFIVAADSVLFVVRNESLYLTSTYFSRKDFLFFFFFINPFYDEIAFPLAYKL